MSSEQINIDGVETPKMVQAKQAKVDINLLLNRVRAEKKKQNKENFIFFWIVASVILSVGIILSL